MKIHRNGWVEELIPTFERGGDEDGAVCARFWMENAPCVTHNLLIMGSNPCGYQRNQYYTVLKYERLHTKNRNLGWLVFKRCSPYGDRVHSIG